MKIEMLKDCRAHLKFLNLCDDNHVPIKAKKLPNVILHICWVFPMALTTVLMWHHCFVNQFDLLKISSAFAVSLGSTQLILIYITLVINKKVTFDTMMTVQRFVEYRKLIQWRMVRIYFVISVA